MYDEITSRIAAFSVTFFIFPISIHSIKYTLFRHVINLFVNSDCCHCCSASFNRLIFIFISPTQSNLSCYVYFSSSQFARYSHDFFSLLLALIARLSDSKSLWTCYKLAANSTKLGIRSSILFVTVSRGKNFLHKFLDQQCMRRSGARWCMENCVVYDKNRMNWKRSEKFLTQFHDANESILGSSRMFRYFMRYCAFISSTS